MRSTRFWRRRSRSSTRSRRSASAWAPMRKRSSAASRAEQRIGPQERICRPGRRSPAGRWRAISRSCRRLAADIGLPTPLVVGVLGEQRRTRHWAHRTLTAMLGRLAGAARGRLGPDLQAGTDTLRRSRRVELCRLAGAQGARVHGLRSGRSRAARRRSAGMLTLAPDPRDGRCRAPSAGRRRDRMAGAPRDLDADALVQRDARGRSSSTPAASSRRPSARTRGSRYIAVGDDPA